MLSHYSTSLQQDYSNDNFAELVFWRDDYCRLVSTLGNIQILPNVVKFNRLWLPISVFDVTKTICLFTGVNFYGAANFCFTFCR